MMDSPSCFFQIFRHPTTEMEQINLYNYGGAQPNDTIRISSYKAVIITVAEMLRLRLELVLCHVTIPDWEPSSVNA